MREDGSSGSKARAHSKKTRTSQGASSRLSVKRQRLSRRIRAAVLRVRQSFENDQLNLLQEEAEAERAFHQRRNALQEQLMALQRQQEEAERACKRQQKEIATSQKLVEMEAMNRVTREFEVKHKVHNQNILRTSSEAEEEMKEEGRKRVVHSTCSPVKMVTAPSQQDVTPLLSGNGVEGRSGRIITSSEVCLTSLVLREHCDKQDTYNQTSDVLVTTKCKHQVSIENSRDMKVFDQIQPSPIRNEMLNVRSKIQRSEVVRELSDLKPAAEQMMTSCSAEVDMFMLTEGKCSSAVQQVEHSEVVAQAEDNSDVQRPVIRSGVISRFFKSSGDAHLASCKTTALQRNVMEASWAEADVAENVTVPSRMHWQSHGRKERRKERRKRKRLRL